MNETYGIDFGTTNSVLARATATDVETIALDDGAPVEWATLGFDRVMPSVIGRADGAYTYGWKAKLQRTNRLEAVKRLFATDDRITVGDVDIEVELAASQFFAEMRHKAQQAGLVRPLDQAVVTIPANSRGKARYRTKVSAGLAGIEVLALINEPTAAAMAYAREIEEDQRILVYDFGGGTLDVTVLQSFEGTFIEQSSKGVQRLGGIDLDAALLDVLRPRIPDLDSWADYELGSFRNELERAKVRLSTAESVTTVLPRGGKSLTVTREELEQAIEPLVRRSLEPVAVCLKESPGKIDHLVMVGGTSKIPLVQRLVSAAVGVPVNSRVDPMTAIAEGAAIAAGILQGTITDLDFHVGTEHALGTIVHNDTSPKDGEFSVLIPRNTKYPARATDTYVPAHDFQESIQIRVVEGDPEKPISHEDNVELKDWEIDLPGQRLKADAAFTVTYTYTVNGTLEVLVKDVATGVELMSGEVGFGAGEDRRRLADLHARMVPPEGEPAVASQVGGWALSETSQAAVRKARERLIPFVIDIDRQELEQRVDALLAATADTEDALRDDLEREMRKHAYLL
ncbi:Hsp70 family protein [Actinocorallia sp. API 0066]|uniref:Hsp70 family protein n=1 Tax=Actinocorallia sp. API 0066 TaxID=2896846 RepID=UPI001E5B538D|nr:Hsp70 family protein [Actinocorallia sp. API 0066]MCD0447617.1 Hsp70 family protein [Actinocorallia sp. API 0066]